MIFFILLYSEYCAVDQAILEAKLSTGCQQIVLNSVDYKLSLNNSGRESKIRRPPDKRAVYEGLQLYKKMRVACQLFFSVSTRLWNFLAIFCQGDLKMMKTELFSGIRTKCRLASSSASAASSSLVLPSSIVTVAV